MISSILIFLRGCLMGIADSIPGVSGGTVAMIVGIYERLIQSISNLNSQFLNLLFKRKWAAAARHVDLGFLMLLLLGIAAGLGGSSIVMHDLLKNHLSVTFAAFMGMILASVIILFRQIQHKDFICGIAMTLGAAAAWFITSIPHQPGQDQNLLYIFGCGLIAICAMILPGISGSYVLLILGEYAHIISRVKELAQGRTTPQDLLTLCIFGCGCVIGLLSFSHILKYLLKNHHSVTLSVLTGFMLGSLRSLWPFQEQVGHSFRTLEMSNFPMQSQIAILCSLLAGFVGVLLLEKVASALSHSSK